VNVVEYVGSDPASTLPITCSEPAAHELPKTVKVALPSLSMVALAAEPVNDPWFDIQRTPPSHLTFRAATSSTVCSA